MPFEFRPSFGACRVRRVTFVEWRQQPANSRPGYSSCGGILISKNHNTATTIKIGIACTLNLPMETIQRVTITAPDRCFRRYRNITCHDFLDLRTVESRHGAFHLYQR